MFASDAGSRLRRVVVIVVFASLGALAVVTSASYAWVLAPVAAGSTRDRFERPAAWDFRAFYSAAHFASQGRPAAAYDEARMQAYGRELFGQDTPLIPWPYPPSTVLPLEPLGALGYSHALLLWVGLGLGSLALAIFVATRPRHLLLLGLLSPSVAYAITSGQISVYMAALLLAGLGLLRRAPSWAGALLGLLVLKPQLALLVPVLLFTWRDRRVLAGACASASGLVLSSVLVFGWRPWLAFWSALPHHGADLFAHARPDLWARVPTVYVLLRQLGASASGAWSGHALIALVSLALLWRGLRLPGVDDGRRALLLVSATLLSVPYVWDYDLVILVVPALLIWRDRGSDERPLLAIVLFFLASLGPGLRYLTAFTGLQLGPLAWAALLVWASWPRVWPHGEPSHVSP
ncbi:MAG: DUF2029 domain-containing protein [Deltaproteobacteria bacterium]|nr:DUF2029 domain-containing protein [Deltaproteobacteria bacterium]